MDDKKKNGMRKNPLIILLPVILLAIGFVYFIIVLLSRLYVISFVLEKKFQVSEKVIALQITDLNGDDKNELLVLKGEKTENCEAVVSVYDREGKSFIKELSKISVYLERHSWVSYPSISVGDVDENSKTEIMISNGPMLVFDNGLKEKWKRRELINNLIKGGLRDWEGGKRIEWVLLDSMHIVKTSSKGGNYLYVLQAKEGGDGPIIVNKWERANKFKKIGKIAGFTQYMPSFGDIDNNGKNEFLASKHENMKTYQIVCPYKMEIELPPLLPRSIGDLDNDSENEILGIMTNFNRLDWVVVHFGDKKPRLNVAKGLRCSPAFHSETPAAIGDIDNDGKNELLLVDPRKPKEIQVYSVKK